MPVTDVFDLDLENTEDLQAPKFEPLPNGNYELVVAKNPEVSETKPSEKNPNGAVMIKLEYNTEHPETNVSQKVWDNLILTKTTLWKVRQWLLSLGFTGTNMTSAQILDPEFLSGLVGRECNADLLTKPNEYPKGSGNFTMRTTVAQYTSDEVPSRNTKPTTAFASAAGPDDLDDIPF
jgi:hypothetical protein